MFYNFGLGLNLFLLVLLVSKSNKSTADKILAAWLFVIACHLALYVISLQPITIKNIHQFGIGIPFPFLHGPFLYLYTAAITNQFPSNRKLCWLHFIPAAITVIYLAPFFSLDAQQKMVVYQNKGSDYRIFLAIQGILMQLSGLIYVVWCFLLLRKHKKNIGQLFSYEERINLNWLRYLIYALLAVWIVIILVRQDSFIFASVVIFVMLIGFFGIRQIGIFNNTPAAKAGLRIKPDTTVTETIYSKGNIEVKIDEQFENAISDVEKEGDTGEIMKESEPDIEVDVKKKYARSGLSKEAAKDIHKRLKQLMETEKLFKDPELTLSGLATRLNIHPNYLSQVINDIEALNFYDYINTLRVDEFKKIVALPENKHYTILSIAYDCGFNSKSAFNRFFKKSTQVSPSEYLKSIK